MLHGNTYVESKKAKLIETESRVVVTKGWEVGEMGRFWSRVLFYAGLSLSVTSVVAGPLWFLSWL